MHILVGLSLLSALTAGPVGTVPTGPINPDESDAIHEWPAVKQGVWSIEGTLVSKGKKTRKWKSTTKRCEDPTTLFQGYWGRGKAEKNDCLFQSTKVSSSKFEIVGECLVEQNEVVKSESIVTTRGQDAFEMQVKFQDGKTDAKATETAHWVSACSEADAGKSATEKSTSVKASAGGKPGSADEKASPSATTAEGNAAR